MIEQLQIRKAIFILDKTRRYGFDVNQNITIQNLKRMIIVAANLHKATLRVFHEGIEYTNRDYESLDMLFPDKHIVEFTLGIEFHSEEELDSLLQIRLNKNYCSFHDAKYPYFYCYDCKKSICSTCLLSGDHSGHDIKEKYDCLQSSRLLIEKLFQDINCNLEKINDDKIQQIKQTITIQFSSDLVQLVKKIENEFKSLVIAFVNQEKDNIDKVKMNLIQLKNQCTEGLDAFKNEHDIEDLIIDEQLFLAFDKQFKDISTEKELINKDIQNCVSYSQILDIIIKEVNKTYEEIRNFLQKTLKTDMYNKLRKQIEQTIINDIRKENVFGKYNKDNVIANNQNDHQQKIELFQDVDTMTNEDDKMELDNEQHDNNINNNNNNDPFHNNNSSKNNKYTPFQLLHNKVNKSFDNNNNELYLCQPKENSLDIIIYHRNDEKKESISFNKIPNNYFPFQTFPKKCSWYNHKNKLYISGGYINCPLDLFFEYNPIQNTITLLQDMPEKRYGHTMCIDNMDNLYIVGGNSNTILKYNLISKTWSTIGLTLSTQRNHPSCMIRDNTILYVFYGVNDSKKYIESIEMGNLLSSGECSVINREKVDLVYAGLIPSDSNSVLVIGGLNEKEKQLKSAKKFNFINNTIENTTFLIDEGACFHQSLLPELGGGTFGYFSLEGEMNFMKVRFD